MFGEIVKQEYRDLRVDDRHVIRHLYVFSDQKKYLLFHPVTGHSVIVTQDVWQNIEAGKCSKGMQVKLAQRGFFETEPESYTDHDIPKPEFFLINMTDSCNLHCKYCFRDVHTISVPNINEKEIREITKYIVDYCKSYNVNDITIQPWGGEPLLAYDRILYLDGLFKKTGLRYQIVFATNATLITEKMAVEMKARNFHIGISLDGDSSLHNLQRPTKLKSGNSYELVRAGFNNLTKAGYSDLGVIGTITRLNADKIVDIIDTYVLDFDLHSVKLNIVKANPFAADSQSISIMDEDRIGEFYDNLINRLIYWNEKGHFIFERNIADKLQNLLTNNQNNICIAHGCLGGEKMISFNRKGDIYPCELVDVESVRMGSIYDQKTCPEVISDSKETNPFFRSRKSSKCDECPWFVYCKGGCSASVIYNEFHSVNDELECKINMVLYPKLVDIIINKQDMVWYLTNKLIKIKE